MADPEARGSEGRCLVRWSFGSASFSLLSWTPTACIVRAWKDPEYRKSLTPEELASLPPNPAGDPEISAQDLDTVSGGER